MQMKCFKLLLSLGLLALLTACVEKIETRVVEPAAQPVPSPMSGGGDSGGGNSYLGKPLESYIRKPMDLPAFKNTVQRILKEAIPDIRSPMTYVLDAKVWYFVPGPLSALPANQIGSVVATDQAALQDFKQVWIDLDLFEKMSEADQGKLILHEVLMGFKLLKFESLRITCFAVRFNYPEFSTECQTQPNVQTGKPSDLTVLDYAEIRQMTDQLLTMDLSVLDGPLKWRTLFNKGNFHFPGMYYVNENDSQHSTFQKNLTALKRNLDLGYQPVYGYSMDDLKQLVPGWKRPDQAPPGTIWKSSAPCKVEVSISPDEKSFHLNVEVGTYKVEGSFEPGSGDPFAWDHLAPWIDGKFNWRRMVAPVVRIPTLPSAPGRIRLDSIFAHFDSGNRLKAVVIEEWYEKGPGSTHGAFYDEVLAGHYFICSVSPEIQFQTNSSPRKNSW